MTYIVFNLRSSFNHISIKTASVASVFAIRHLPGHGPLAQSIVSLLDPGQSFSPSDGGGLVQVRERSLVPFPQVVLHAPQSPQSLHSPPIGTVKREFN